MSTTFSGLMRPTRRSSAARSSPSTSSMVKNSSSPAWATSKTRHTAGWLTSRASRTSLSNRSQLAGSEVCSSLSATSTPSTVSWTR